MIIPEAVAVTARILFIQGRHHGRTLSVSRAGQRPAAAGTDQFGTSLRMFGGVEGKIRNETRGGEQHDRDKDSHGYNSSNFAMLDSMR
jgi:hypothetical protein